MGKICAVSLLILSSVIIGVEVNSLNEELESRLRFGDLKLRTRTISTVVETQEINNETKIHLFLSALADEIQKPSSNKLIENGYVTEAEYFKRQYMQALVTIGENRISQIKRVLKVTKRNRFNNARKTAVEWEERSILILGALSDKKVLPNVRKLLIQSKDGNIRTTAAHTIKTVRDKKAIPQLKIALSDPYYVSYKMHSKRRTIFPVRAKAAAALMTLGVYVNFNGNQYSVSPSPSQDR